MKKHKDKDKKIECQKDDETSKQKRAQRFIKIALPRCWNKITVLSEYFCRADIIPTPSGKSAQGAPKATKSVFHAYCSHIICNKHPNTNTTRPCRAYSAYFKP